MSRGFAHEAPLSSVFRGQSSVSDAAFRPAANMKSCNPNSLCRMLPWIEWLQARSCAYELAGGHRRILLKLSVSSAFLSQAPMAESLRNAPACSDGAYPWKQAGR